MADRIEVGDLARIDAVFAPDPTNGTIRAGSTELTVADATDYQFGDTVLVTGAGPGGSDLFSIISNINGRTVTLADIAHSSVTNTDVGKAEDPTSVAVTVTTPTGVQTSPGVARDAVGQYHSNYTTTEPGVHHYEFVGTGAASAVITGMFEVAAADQATLSARALCTLGELKQFINNVTSLEDEANLVAAVNAASTRIIREAGREFVARNAVRNPNTGIVTVDPETRRFLIDPALTNERELWVGDLAAVDWPTPTPGALTLSTLATASTTPTGLAVTDLTYNPSSRDSWEPIRRIQIPSTVTLTRGHLLEVTAIWGFPQIPDDIREACKQLAAGSYLRDVRRWSRAVDEEGSDLPRTLIGSALRTARDYRMDSPIASLQVS